MKNKDILIIALIGYGIYWYFKSKKTPVATSDNAVAPDTSMVMPTTTAADYNVKFAIGKLKQFGNVPNTI